MRKVRVVTIAFSLFFAIFGLFFMIGTSFLNMIPVLRDLLMFKVEGQYEIYYGLTIFVHMWDTLTHMKEMVFSNNQWLFLIAPLVMLLFGGFISFVHLVLSIIKLRFEMLLYLIPLGILGLLIPFFVYFFFGIPLNLDGTGYVYFISIILNMSSPILTHVLFIIVFVNFVLIFLPLGLFFPFVIFAPRRSKKWLAKQREKEFANIKEVREISIEEFKKYIQEHKEEVTNMLGITKEGIKPVEQAHGEVTPEPVVEEVAPTPVNEETKPLSNQELSKEIAKAVAEKINTDKDSKTTIIVEAGKAKEEKVIESSPKKAPSTKKEGNK